MPNFDGTGPLRKGPYTGRGGGFCIFKRDTKNVTDRWYGFAGEKLYQQEFIQTKSRKEAMNMPAGDKTGPRGLGPMTGRAASYCAGYGRPGYLNPAPGVVSAYYAGAYPPAFAAGPGFYNFPSIYGGWGCGRRRGGGRGRTFRW